MKAWRKMSDLEIIKYIKPMNKEETYKELKKLRIGRKKAQYFLTSIEIDDWPDRISQEYESHLNPRDRRYVWFLLLHLEFISRVELLLDKL